MSDYAKPTDAAAAIKQEAETLRDREQQYRHTAALLLAKADEVHVIYENLLDAVDRYAKFQPKPDT